MFSDTGSKHLLRRKTFSQEISASAQPEANLRSTEDMKQLMQVQGSHRTLFYRQPSRKHVSSYSTVFVNMEGSEKKVSFEKMPDAEGIVKKEKASMVITLPVKSEKFVTKETQTDYRESEAQTLPWRHEIKAQEKILSEFLALDWFTQEKNYPPGTEEVMLIEKARQKLAWEDIIERLKGKENEYKRKSLTLKMTLNETAFRDCRKDEEDKERIELSRREMKKEKETFEEKLWLRLQNSSGFRRMKNDSKIDYWNHQLTRKIRKMKSARNQLGTKSDIIEMHLNKGSDLWAPKLRNGENPLLRHEAIDIQCRFLKRFHGLEILEKHLSHILYPDFFKPVNEFQYRTSKKLGLCLRIFREKVIKTPKEELVGHFSLRIPVPPPTPEPLIPETSKLRSDSEENLYQASLLLRKIIKGRSVQTQKFVTFLNLM